jgi:preprotein translocase subunit SecD
LKGVYLAALLVIACESGCVSTIKPSATATPTASPSALVVFTTWVADRKVTNGPQPGNKPAFTGLTGHDIQSATPAIDSAGTSWVVYISFTQRGTNLFAKLTRDNVAACSIDSGTGGNCAQRHLGIWLELTQADIDNWEDPTYASRVSQPYDLSCLTHLSSTTPCPKLLSDPITLEEIVSGNAALTCACTQQGAKELAASISSVRRG